MPSALANNRHYVRYLQAPTLPLGCPEFDCDPAGLVIVHLDERRCRVPAGNDLCGRFLGTRGTLRNHIRTQHAGYYPGIAPSENEEGRPSAALVLREIAFYQALWVEHDRLTEERANTIRERQRLRGAEFTTQAQVAPILIKEGPMMGEFDLAAMTQFVLRLGRRAPCAVCEEEYPGDDECKFEYEYDDDGRKVAGGKHCHNVDVWQI